LLGWLLPKRSKKRTVEKTFDFQGARQRARGTDVDESRCGQILCDDSRTSVEVQKPAVGSPASVANARPEIRARLFDGSIEHPAQVENLLSRDEQEQLQRIANIDRVPGVAGIPSFQRVKMRISCTSSTTASCASAATRKMATVNPGSQGAGDLSGFRWRTNMSARPETVGRWRILRIPWQRMFQTTIGWSPQLQLNLSSRRSPMITALAGSDAFMVLGQQIPINALGVVHFSSWLSGSRFFDQRSSRLKASREPFRSADYLGTAPEIGGPLLRETGAATGLVRRVTIPDIGNSWMWTDEGIAARPAARRSPRKNYRSVGGNAF